MYEKLVIGLNNIKDDKKDLVIPVLEELKRTQCFIKANLRVRCFWNNIEDLDPKGRFENTIYAIKEFFKSPKPIKTNNNSY
jgi:hypothetical protein